MKATERPALAPNDPRHGTANGYRNLGCRCDACREAHTVYHREWRHRSGYTLPLKVWRKMIEGTTAPHGTETRYCAGCRCKKCRLEANEARWRRRHADFEAARAYERSRLPKRAAARAAARSAHS